MKKTALLGTLLVLTGCATKQKAPESEFYAEVPEINAPCSYSCTQNACAEVAPEPLVLKPRVLEEYRPHKKRRCCPDEEYAQEKQKLLVPELPEIYVISANRTVNSMLKDVNDIFDGKTYRVYVDETKKNADDLPLGLDKGTKTIVKRLNNVNTILLTDKQDADYFVETVADWFDTPTKQVPAIKYTLTLQSKDGIKIGEWMEVVHQTEGDRSWW